MQIAEIRIATILGQFSEIIDHIFPVEIDEGFLKIIIFLRDGTNLRVTERWINADLEDYSYYWLDEDDRLKIGWDNVPHHTQLENFPHHKHIGSSQNRISSYETSLELVMKVIEELMNK
ncbi:hypothetical protein KJ693_10620 [bacterium]|nr:hypothetical protein [bacterium]MBU1615743.1 hypothetical protein [bacterium]